MATSEDIARTERIARETLAQDALTPSDGWRSSWGSTARVIVVDNSMVGYVDHQYGAYLWLGVREFLRDYRQPTPPCPTCGSPCPAKRGGC